MATVINGWRFDVDRLTSSTGSVTEILFLAQLGTDSSSAYDNGGIPHAARLTSENDGKTYRTITFHAKTVRQARALAERLTRPPQGSSNAHD